MENFLYTRGHVTIEQYGNILGGYSRHVTIEQYGNNILGGYSLQIICCIMKE